MVRKEGPKSNSEFRIHRSSKNSILGGICSGLAESLEIDPTILRIIFVLFTIFGGSGILIYIILWIIMPSNSQIVISKDNLKENFQEIKDRTKKFAHDIKLNKSIAKTQDNRGWIALIVVLIGLVFLFNNYGLGEVINFGKLWPLILVVIGITLFLRK